MGGPIAIRRILCPTDFSDISRAALAAATSLARWFEAKIETLYVYPLTRPPYSPEAPYFPVITEPSDDTRQQILGDLRKLADPARNQGIEVTARVESGEPDDIICRIAANSDLVVMGTHGHRDFERFLLGSTTERVLWRAPCSVLTICPASIDSKASNAPFRRILCALDLSSGSRSTLDYALSLSQEAQANLMLLSVVEDLPDVDARHMPFDVPEYRRYRVADARDGLHQIVAIEARNGCQIEERVEVGKPYKEVLKWARNWDADVIVLGAHGPAAFMPIGSTTQRVVRAAHCPVLTVRLRLSDPAPSDPG